jgi:hypothetical protein
VRGRDGDIEAALDEAYRKLPNPIAVTPYTPSSARTTRTVLAELFTGSGCGPCASADLAFEGVLARYPRDVVAALAYHVNIPAPDPMTAGGSVARKEYYSVRGAPTMVVDGSWVKLGGGPRDHAERNYNDYTREIDSRLEQPAFGALDVRASTDGARVAVTVSATKLPPSAADLRMHIVLARYHPMTVRAVAGEKGSGFAIPEGSASVAHTFDLAAIAADIEKTLEEELARRRTQQTSGARREYRAEGHAMTKTDPSGLVVVAFVQDGGKRVLQAATAAVAHTPANR